jgi:hypothetical protein
MRVEPFWQPRGAQEGYGGERKDALGAQFVGLLIFGFIDTFRCGLDFEIRISILRLFLFVP